MTTSHIMDQRTAVRKGIVQAVDDTGSVQMAEVLLDDTGVRANVEIMQGFGDGGMPPIDGALALVFAVGGDPGHLVALPLTNPSWRFGGTLNGERVVVDANGQRLHFRQGGLVEIHAGGTLTVFAPNVTIQAPSGLAEVMIDGNITTTGTLTVAGDIYDQNGARGTLNLLRNDHNEHKHTASGGTTSVPNLVTP